MADITESLLTDIAHKNDIVRAANGDLDTIKGLGNIKEALFRRLITVPGALAHRPDYGVGVKEFQNAPNSMQNQRALALRIVDQFKRDFRVQSVTGVRFDTADDKPDRTTIVVKVTIAGFDEVELNFQDFEEIV